MLFVKGHPVYGVFLIISETMQPLCSTLTSDFSLTPLPVSLWAVSLSPQGRGVAQECTTALQAPGPSGNGLFLYTTFIYTHARASPGPCKAARPSSRQTVNRNEIRVIPSAPGNSCDQPQKHKSFPLCYLTFIYIYGLLNLTLTQLLEPMLRGVKGAFGLPATEYPFPFHETSILCAYLTIWGFTVNSRGHA